MGKADERRIGLPYPPACSAREDEAMAELTAPYEALSDLVDDLWAHPELGYGEHHTAERVVEFVRRYAPGLPVERFSTTGVSVRLPALGGRSRVCVIAELDAVISPSHPDAHPGTGAVHACGHHTQVAIALALLAHYARVGTADLGVDLGFVFVPAEEYVDLGARLTLRNNRTIGWFGGKPEAMRLGVFDDYDAAVAVHAMGDNLDRPTIELACDLAGFLHHHATFLGRASHANFDPFSGVNAFSMATLYTTALGLARQQFREDAFVRINPVITHSTMTTNVIPHEVGVSSDVRSTDVAYFVEVTRRLDQAAQGCSAALGGQVRVRTEMGYLPFVQDRAMTTAFRAAAEPYDIDVVDDRGAVAAAGDIGDLSYLMPAVQIGYSGFAGTIHGADFRLVDKEHVLRTVPAFVADGIARLADVLTPGARYRRTYEDYCQYVTAIAGPPGEWARNLKLGSGFPDRPIGAPAAGAEGVA